MKTTTERTKFVIGNWKMNPVSKEEAKRLMVNVQKKVTRAKCTVIVAPPYIHLGEVKSVLKKPYILGAQDVYPGEGGPHTGYIGASMLASYGVTYAIVGHSERRAEGETNEQVNKKVQALLVKNIAPIICVGETERDHHGKFYSFVEAQVRGALSQVTRTQVAKVIVAYEPVWAISKGDGKGQTATAEHAHEMKLYIQKVLVEMYGRAVALRVPILYGGSVNESNASELMTHGTIDGFLVGGASLKPDAFAAIIKSVDISV